MNCPYCGNELRFSADHEGRRARCKSCGKVLTVAVEQVGTVELAIEPVAPEADPLASLQAATESTADPTPASAPMFQQPETPVQQQPPASARPGVTPVRIVDIRMNFISMVVFMVKWALASIPATILLLLIYAVLGFLGFAFLLLIGVIASD